MLKSADQQWLCFVGDNGSEGREEFDKAVEAARQCKVVPYKLVPAEKLSVYSDEANEHMSENAVYVLRSFGTEVHRALQQRHSRVVGPMCVVTALQERSGLPQCRDCSVFTLAMRGAVVCCTNVGERDDRDMLHNLVTLMGGTVMRSLTPSVTHLIAGEVGSAKYTVARKLKLPILLPSWVERAWEVSRREAVRATAAEFVDGHLCPPLRGVCVCVTGVDTVLRRDIRTAAETSGGQYCGELSMEATTHLIADRAGGEKYKHARLWGIPCVKPGWIFECVESQGYVEPVLFEIEPGSTAPLETPDQLSFAGELPVASDGSRKRKRAGESLENPPSKRSLLLSRNSSSGGQLCADVPVPFADMAVRPSETPYLDGCKVLLHGYSGAMLELMRRVINCGGGSRFNQLNATVSHIILDQPSADIRRRLDAVQGVKPHVVTSTWLLESCRVESRMAEESYPCAGMEMEEDRHAGVDESGALPRGTVATTPAATDFSTGMPPPAAAPADDGKAADNESSGNILAQYLPSSTAVSSSSAVASARSSGASSSDQAGGRDGPAPGAIFSSVPPFYVSTGDSVCNALATRILQKGGAVIAVEPSALCYLVCNLADERKPGMKQVTLFWLEKCISAGKILEPSSDLLFEPCGFDVAQTFMSGAVLSLSQYEGQMRTQLSKLAVSMGATVQDHFVRKVSKGLKASTHLLCEMAAGSKHAAAKRWTLPAVNHRWLTACSQQRRLLSASEFLVNSSPSPAAKPLAVVASVTANGSTPTVSEPAAPAVSARSYVSAAGHMPFQPSFDTTDIVAALQSPAVPPRRLNRSSGVGLEEMFQNNLASAVGVCSAAMATENETTHVATERVAAAATTVLASTPTPVEAKVASPPTTSTASRRSMRRGKRPVAKAPLDGVSLQPATPSSQRVTAAAAVATSAASIPSTAGGVKKAFARVESSTAAAASTASPRKQNLPCSKANESEDAPLKPPPVLEIPTAGTLEVREAFEREMDGLMALTSGRSSIGRSSVRRSSRINRNSARSPAGERSGSSPSYTGKSSPSGSTVGALDLDQAHSDGMHGGELSQTEMITYDDPNGRLERERIIAELKEAPDVCSELPLPPVSSTANARPKSFSLATAVAAEDSVSHVPAAIHAGSGSGVPTTPTPPVPVPMIAALRPAAKTRPPLATEDLTVSQAKGRAAQLKFHLTALSQAEKSDYIVLIEKLGGKVYDTMFFSTSCTHLIVGKPSRSEKYLGALASGKWLLRTSFLEASREAGHFIEESDHEWGGQLHRQGKPEAIELAAQRWRLFLHDERLAHQLDGAPSRIAVGAFTDWRVLLTVSREKQAGLKRLLEAGGAKIVKAMPPFNNLKGVTHAFIEVAKVPAGSIDFPKLKEASIHCCRPEYIAEYLIQDPAPGVTRYYIADVYSKRRGGD